MVPTDINKRLLYFQNEIKTHFSFLVSFGYNLQHVETGRSENFLNCYAQVKYLKDKTSILIQYHTDIIKGHTIAFPQGTQLPVTDNLISCSIADANAFMSVSQFAEMTNPQVSKDAFWIEIDADDIISEIIRVVKNYCHFLQEQLPAVIKQEKMFSCYTDREYQKVFKELHYR